MRRNLGLRIESPMNRRQQRLFLVTSGPGRVRASLLATCGHVSGRPSAPADRMLHPAVGLGTSPVQRPSPRAVQRSRPRSSAPSAPSRTQRVPQRRPGLPLARRVALLHHSRCSVPTSTSMTPTERCATTRLAASSCSWRRADSALLNSSVRSERIVAIGWSEFGLDGSRPVWSAPRS